MSKIPNFDGRATGAGAFGLTNGPNDRPQTGEELLAIAKTYAPVLPIYHGLFSTCSVNLIYGPSKSYKTAFAWHLAKCIAEGREIDAFKFPAGPLGPQTVIYGNVELSPQQHTQRMGGEALQNLTHTPRAKFADWVDQAAAVGDQLHALRRFVETTQGLNVVFLDNLTRVVPASFDPTLGARIMAMLTRDIDAHAAQGIQRSWFVLAHPTSEIEGQMRKNPMMPAPYGGVMGGSQLIKGGDSYYSVQRYPNDSRKLALQQFHRRDAEEWKMEGVPGAVVATMGVYFDPSGRQHCADAFDLLPIDDVFEVNKPGAQAGPTEDENATVLRLREVMMKANGGRAPGYRSLRAWMEEHGHKAPSFHRIRTIYKANGLNANE